MREHSRSGHLVNFHDGDAGGQAAVAGPAGRVLLDGEAGVDAAAFEEQPPHRRANKLNPMSMNKISIAMLSAMEMHFVCREKFAHFIRWLWGC